ncbi:maker517 [Drosophila busckii]|uniref:Maker517 n=1 Tax=Drosophila busckii TaxID=30019 RepID=A0A0M4EB06_DROBS|nr:maker517 [Drosophila busckii]
MDWMDINQLSIVVKVTSQVTY